MVSEPLINFRGGRILDAVAQHWNHIGLTSHDRRWELYWTSWLPCLLITTQYLDPSLILVRLRFPVSNDEKMYYFSMTDNHAKRVAYYYLWWIEILFIFSHCMLGRHSHFYWYLLALRITSNNIQLQSHMKCPVNIKKVLVGFNTIMWI